MVLLLLGLDQCLVELLASVVADGVVLLLERLPRRLSVSEYILRILALVMPPKFSDSSFCN